MRSVLVQLYMCISVLTIQSVVINVCAVILNTKMICIFLTNCVIFSTRLLFPHTVFTNFIR